MRFCTTDKGIDRLGHTGPEGRHTDQKRVDHNWTNVIKAKVGCKRY